MIDLEVTRGQIRDVYLKMTPIKKPCTKFHGSTILFNKKCFFFVLRLSIPDPMYCQEMFNFGDMAILELYTRFHLALRNQWDP